MNRRTELKSTPMKPRQSGLKGTKGLASKRGTISGKGPGPKTTEELQRSGLARKHSISPASPAQRKKARTEPCVVTAVEQRESFDPIDPAHLCPRSHGGCDDPLCVVPLARVYHRRFDDGKFDLLPYLVGKRVPELQHALGHYEGNLLGLLQRLTGERYGPA